MPIDIYLLSNEERNKYKDTLTGDRDRVVEALKTLPRGESNEELINNLLLVHNTLCEINTFEKHTHHHYDRLNQSQLEKLIHNMWEERQSCGEVRSNLLWDESIKASGALRKLQSQESDIPLAPEEKEKKGEKEEKVSPNPDQWDKVTAVAIMNDINAQMNLKDSKYSEQLKRRFAIARCRFDELDLDEEISKKQNCLTELKRNIGTEADAGRNVSVLIQNSEKVSQELEALRQNREKVHQELWALQQKPKIASFESKTTPVSTSLPSNPAPVTRSESKEPDASLEFVVHVDYAAHHPAGEPGALPHSDELDLVKKISEKEELLKKLERDINTEVNAGKDVIDLIQNHEKVREELEALKQTPKTAQSQFGLFPPPSPVARSASVEVIVGEAVIHPADLTPAVQLFSFPR